MSYNLLKALHIIFVVSWFAGLFYIFRLFVYHIENWEKEDVTKVFLVMERKLLNYIMTPALLLTLYFGVMMLIENPVLLKAGWMHIKLCMVLFLFVYHGYSYYVHSQLKRQNKILTSKWCRIINEVPTIALIVISLMVFLRPI